MSYEPTELVQTSWSRPPTCLAPFRLKPLIDGPTDAMNEFAYFGVSCKCGSNVWKVVGFPVAPDLLLCPLSLQCSQCGREEELFDIAKHGHDAELGLGCYSRRAEGSPSQVACPQCDGGGFSVRADFSYQFDPDELNEEERAKVQDIFDVFGVALTCADCGHTSSPCEYECA